MLVGNDHRRHAGIDISSGALKESVIDQGTGRKLFLGQGKFGYAVYNVVVHLPREPFDVGPFVWLGVRCDSSMNIETKEYR